MESQDVRRYGYWSVFAGAAGFTYGDNAVMQFRKAGEKTGAYGANDYWFDAINDPGAGQMIWLKKLMLSKPYFGRIPDQALVSDQGKKYDYIAATRGKDYAFFYDYSGRNFKVNMKEMPVGKFTASWYNPRNGKETKIGIFATNGIREFNPPGEKKDGNDWVLILEKS
jgi:hypothetical protein